MEDNSKLHFLSRQNGEELPHFLTQTGSKKAGCPIFNSKKRVKKRLIRSKSGKPYQSDLYRKAPENRDFSGL
ncbi:MAG: hypothetical protein LUD79_04805 [Oscillospiraceae bacterium]|nr:hypothetical protein [Oscillospiraceae bacterium]